MGARSLLSKAGNFLNIIQQVTTIIWPIVRGALGMSQRTAESVDEIMSYIREPGKLADDILDRNLRLMAKMRLFFQKLMLFAQNGYNFFDFAITSSQVNTPDEITSTELIGLRNLAIDLADSAKDLTTFTNETPELQVEKVEFYLGEDISQAFEVPKLSATAPLQLTED